MKCKLMTTQKRDKQGAHILLSEKQKVKRYLMIITCLMHFAILQAQAVENSTQTSLELTFQPSSESGSGFYLIQNE